MPAFFLCFLLFCAWLYYERRKNKRAEEQTSTSFWERESKANTTRRQDTSDIAYIKIDLGVLPFSENAGGAEKELQDRLLSLKDQPAADLSAYSNTDLKLRYGRPNFDMLSAADENYNVLITTLADWGALLHSSGRDCEALAVLDAARGYGSNALPVYTTLADIYCLRGEPERIKALIDEVSSGEMLTKNAVLSSLRQTLARCYASLD